MKTRRGFVSNSSSSSFVVIGKAEKEAEIPESAYNASGELPIPNDNGNFGFGWETRIYGNILDRINFTFCQVLLLCEESFPPKKTDSGYEAYSTFMKVLKDKGIKPKLIMEEEDAKEEHQFIYAMSLDFYIDHQSSVIEGKNMEILESYDSMHDFIFKEGSYIRGGNDN